MSSTASLRLYCVSINKMFQDFPLPSYLQLYSVPINKMFPDFPLPSCLQLYSVPIEKMFPDFPPPSSLKLHLYHSLTCEAASKKWELQKRFFYQQIIEQTPVGSTRHMFWTFSAPQSCHESRILNIYYYNKQEGNSLTDLRRMNDLNDLINDYTVIGTYSIEVIIWSYLDFDISF